MINATYFDDRADSISVVYLAVSDEEKLIKANIENQTLLQKQNKNPQAAQSHSCRYVCNIKHMQLPKRATVGFPF